MKVPKYVMPIIAIVALLGTVQVSIALGYWVTSGRSPVIVDEKGYADPATIKGWMTLASITETYGIPQERLYEAAGLPADQDPATELKELESVVPNFEVEVVREAIRQYYEEAGIQP